MTIFNDINVMVETLGEKAIMSGAATDEENGAYAVCEEVRDDHDFESYFGQTGAFYDLYVGEALPRKLVTELEAFEVMRWKRRADKPPCVQPISTKLFHK